MHLLGRAGPGQEGINLLNRFLRELGKLWVITICFSSLLLNAAFLIWGANMEVEWALPFWNALYRYRGGLIGGICEDFRPQ